MEDLAGLILHELCPCKSFLSVLGAYKEEKAQRNKTKLQMMLKQKDSFIIENRTIKIWCDYKIGNHSFGESF